MCVIIPLEYSSLTNADMQICLSLSVEPLHGWKDNTVLKPHKKNTRIYIIIGVSYKNNVDY